jgi:CheY-like chemotaxis protein
VTLVTSTVRTLQVQAKQANVKLQLLSNFKDESSELFEVVRRDMCIIGDSMKLSQVIRNVVSNALKFSATGDTVSVTGEIGSAFPLTLFIVSHHPHGLRAVNLDSLSHFTDPSVNLSEYSHSGSLVVQVTDHGPGMDDHELSRLFSEGVQFNPNQLQAGQGSGLGLWISKGIIELHLGKLSATSPGLGCGSSFTLEIPLACRNCPLLLSPSSDPLDLIAIDPLCLMSSDQETKTADYRPHGLKKILLVDDTATNRKIVRRILKIDGFTDVDEAKDGLECVEMVSSRPPHEPWYDLILMDYEMPRMNGPTATSRLRELGYAMPIIGVTGNVLSADVSFFIESGVDSVLPKPVVMKDLYEAYVVSLSKHSQK